MYQNTLGTFILFLSTNHFASPVQAESNPEAPLITTAAMKVLVLKELLDLAPPCKTSRFLLAVLPMFQTKHTGYPLEIILDC